MRGVAWTGAMEIRDDIGVRDPGPREVRVRIERAGLCHSDVSVVNGTIPFPTPVIMGHEGAGVVESVGSAVTSVQPGDHVILATLGNCGQCEACDRGIATQCRNVTAGGNQRFTLAGEPAYQFANAGVFAEHTVVFETQAVKIDERVPFDVASLIGCAVLTGAGSVINLAKVRPGDTVMVIGGGGIGQCAIQAARICGASRIVVVDANPAKEAAVRQFGATEFVAAGEGVDTVAAVKDLGLPNGVDHAFECVGHPALIRQALELTDWGGNCVIVGTPKLGSEMTVPVQATWPNKHIIGSRYGASRPHYDIPMYVNYYLDGRLKLDEMVSRTYDIADIQTAMDDLHEGKLNRGVLSFA